MSLRENDQAPERSRASAPSRGSRLVRGVVVGNASTAGAARERATGACFLASEVQEEVDVARVRGVVQVGGVGEAQACGHCDRGGVVLLGEDPNPVP